LHAYELFVWAPKINWEHIDRIILVSNNMKKNFTKLYPEHSHKVEVIYNGISVEKFQPPPQRMFGLNIGMLCRIHPVKRIYEIILMVYALKKQGYNPHLHIAGDREPGGYFDDYYRAILSLIEKLGLKNDVILYGAVDNASEWLKKIDIYISNSYFEGQQVALLEAMAAGCYCLSHFWDGADEIVPPGNLFSTEADLQEKIIGYCNQPDEDKRQQQSLMRSIACEKFDIRHTIGQINRVIGEYSNLSS
jgi:glycosyltransferase involved in cell wall biosynthesis